jgi:hypothetical protein
VVDENNRLCTKDPGLLLPDGADLTDPVVFLHAIITWDGEGEDIAESEVMTVHGCNKVRRSKPFPPPDRLMIRGGLVLPPGATLSNEHYEVSESFGPWVSGLSQLETHHFREAAPGLPGHTWVALAVVNAHRVNARNLRVRGQVK